MKKTGIYAGIAFVILAGIILYKSCRHDTIASYFDRDDEGWMVVGDAQGGSAIPDYENKDGNPGGYVSANDNAAGGVWYWSAPEKFLGNRSSSFGKKLSFSLKQSSTDNQFDADDLILFGADKKIVYNTSRNPDTTWTDYSVVLKEATGWTYNDSDGDPVSRNDFIKILRDLTALHIRGEYVTGEDIGGLDSVILYSK
jgi:alkaline phosphatase D